MSGEITDFKKRPTKKTRLKSIFIFFVLIFFVLMGTNYFFNFQDNEPSEVSYGSEKYKDLVIVNSPLKNQKVSNVIKLEGEARGYWYFEGSFPISVEDGSGNVLLESFVQAKGEWMTEEYVPFYGEIDLSGLKINPGKIFVVFKKDNPSGLPENDDSFKIVVVFESDKNSGEEISEIPALKECKPTGCSGQICSDEEVASTCEFKEEYACYKNAVCERQESGQCGWTETAELTQCVLDKKKESLKIPI